MAPESVRIWRPTYVDSVLLMAGCTSSYALEPRGAYVFGVISDQPMRARRGRDRWLVRPGEFLAWDPSGAHAGTGVDDRMWSARLMVIDAAKMVSLGSDQESGSAATVSFPEPVLSDPHIAGSFSRLYDALSTNATRLERDEMLAQWLQAVIARSGASRPPRSSLGYRDDRALRLAMEYLGDQPERNISLDELAAAAGIGKFRMLRLFRDRTGLPPHALQIAHRVRRAQHLLEAGHSIAHVAVAAGFADQSHLNRHFRRSLGMTPRNYQSRISS